MKNSLNFQNIFLVIAFVYVVICVERYLNKDDSHSQAMVEYQSDKLEMQETINTLNSKIHTYEIVILKNNVDIINMSKSERDSTRELLNPR